MFCYIWVNKLGGKEKKKKRFASQNSFLAFSRMFF